MSENRLRDLLAVLPDEDESAARAARARRRALARLGAAAQPRKRRLWAPALATVLMALGLLWWREAQRAEPDLAQPLQPERLELHWVLSDGTRVQWVFAQDFSL